MLVLLILGFAVTCAVTVVLVWYKSHTDADTVVQAVYELAARRFFTRRRSPASLARSIRRSLSGLCLTLPSGATLAAPIALVRVSSFDYDQLAARYTMEALTKDLAAGYLREALRAGWRLAELDPAVVIVEDLDLVTGWVPPVRAVSQDDLGADNPSSEPVGDASGVAMTLVVNPGKVASSPACGAELRSADGRSVALGRATTVGRARSCDIVVFTPRTSRRHARVVLEAAGTWAIEDLHSTNGTTVNGSLIDAAEPVHLVDGDIVEFGTNAPQQQYTFASEPAPGRHQGGHRK